MSNLLTIELKKVVRYRTFWILILLFAVLLPFWNLSISNGVMNVTGTKGIDILNNAYTFAYVWDNLGYWTSIFVVFITILTIIITTNEYTFRTHRQNVIDGWTRLQFFHAKWLMVLLLAVFTTLYVFIIGLFLGAHYDNMSNFPGHIESLFYVFVLSFNYYSFGLLISLFLKRSGIAIGIFFLYSMIIESLLRGLINWRLDTEAGNFLPLQSSDELLPFPIIDIVKSMAKMEGALPAWEYILASFIWIIIYYIIGRMQILSSDW